MINFTLLQREDGWYWYWSYHNGELCDASGPYDIEALARKDFDSIDTSQPGFIRTTIPNTVDFTLI